MENELINTNADELIIVSQLPVIKEQLVQIKDKVQNVVAEALSLECNSETIAEVKKKRAELNKLARAFEDKRKAVKTAVLTPYEDFEKTYKECVIDSFKEADAELKTKIESVENGQRNLRTAELIAYFNELAEVNGLDFVKYEDMKDFKVTLSESMKSLKETISAWIGKVKADVDMISTLSDAREIMVEYKSTYDSSLSVIRVQTRHEAIEREKKLAEAKEAEKVARAEAEAKVLAEVEKQKQSETVTVPVEVKEDKPDDKIYSVTFTVRGTKAELKELKNYLTERKLSYEC